MRPIRGVTLTLVALILAAAPTAVHAAPPPDCSCEFCVGNAEAKCRLPQGGQTTCGIFMRSGICLGLFTGAEEAASAEPLPTDPVAEAEPAAEPTPTALCRQEPPDR